jgi:hypothetical protein
MGTTIIVTVTGSDPDNSEVTRSAALPPVTE